MLNWIVKLQIKSEDQKDLAHCTPVPHQAKRETSKTQLHHKHWGKGGEFLADVTPYNLVFCSVSDLKLSVMKLLRIVVLSLWLSRLWDPVSLDPCSLSNDPMMKEKLHYFSSFFLCKFYPEILFQVSYACCGVFYSYLLNKKIKTYCYRHKKKIIACQISSSVESYIKTLWK